MGYFLTLRMKRIQTSVPLSVGLNHCACVYLYFPLNLRLMIKCVIWNTQNGEMTFTSIVSKQTGEMNSSEGGREIQHLKCYLMLQQRLPLLHARTKDTWALLIHCNHGNAYYLPWLVVFDSVEGVALCRREVWTVCLLYTLPRRIFATGTVNADTCYKCYGA